MASLVHAAGDFFQRAWSSLKQTTSEAAAAGADIGRYAVRRIRRAEEDPFDIIREALGRTLVLANARLLEAKKATAVCIADEKRLVKMAEQERRHVEEWEQRAVLALRAGDTVLANEARSRAAEHQALVERLVAAWRKAKDASDRQKTELREINFGIEEAKRALNRLHKTRAGRTAADTFRAARQTVRILEAMFLALEIETFGRSSGTGDSGGGAPSGGGEMPN